jgi:GxxExxY protein
MDGVRKNFEQLSEKEETIATQIVDAAYTVHKKLGPGLLEKIYETCLCYELSKRKLAYQRQVNIPVVYDNIVFDEGVRLDILVEDSIICEIKAMESYSALWEAQLLGYLKLTGKRLGFLINFDIAVIRQGIKRIIL